MKILIGPIPSKPSRDSSLRPGTVVVVVGAAVVVVVSTPAWLVVEVDDDVEAATGFLSSLQAASVVARRATGTRRLNTSQSYDERAGARLSMKAGRPPG